MNDLIILGCGGVGRFVLHAVNEINNLAKRWKVRGFIDDDENEYNSSRIEGIPVLGTRDWLKEHPDVSVIVALSDPQVKYNLIKQLHSYGCTNFPAIIHPSAWIAKSVSIEEGTIIYPGTSINVNATIGRFSVINMNCAIGHDVTIDDYSFLAPNVGIGGNSLISEGCNIGIGASVIQSIQIGKWSTVGAGAVVIRNVETEQTVVGVPARPARKKNLLL